MNLLNDQTRAAIIATILSVFPVLQLTGAVSLTGDQISQIMLLVSNVLTFAALIVRSTASTTTTVTTPTTADAVTTTTTSPPNP